MKIDKKLNLVAPVETSRGLAHIHSMPISREVFESNYLVLAKTFSRLYAEGLTVAGPRVAAMLLRTVSQEMGLWEGAEGTQASLINEIKRLTNVMVLRANGQGWDMVPYDSAESKELFDDEDRAEIEGILVFFTLASCLHRKQELRLHLKSSGDLWNFSPESLSTTAYKDSLTTSTLEKISKAKESQTPPTVEPEIMDSPTSSIPH